MDGINKPEKIKTGWDRLDKKTQEKLKKQGIHPLQHTPGRLITKRGIIDGYLSAFGTVWGKMKMNTEQAQKALGFTPKKGAVGVVLSRRKYVDENGKIKDGIFANSLMPGKPTVTDEIKPTHDRARVLSRIAHNHMKDLIHPIWNPLVVDKYKKPWDGYFYFMGLNAQNIGNSLDWSKLLISNGNLPKPKNIYPTRYDREKQKIFIALPRTIQGKPFNLVQVGIGILDIITGSFLHIPPEQTLAHYLSYFPASTSRNILYSVIRQQENPVPEINPLKIDWKLENVMKHFNIKKFKAKKQLARFYIYFYIKAPAGTKIYQRTRIISHKKTTPSFLPPGNSYRKWKQIMEGKNSYSPSLCTRVKLQGYRISMKQTARGWSLPVEINIITN